MNATHSAGAACTGVPELGLHHELGPWSTISYPDEGLHGDMLVWSALRKDELWTLRLDRALAQLRLEFNGALAWGPRPVAVEPEISQPEALEQLRRTPDFLAITQQFVRPSSFARGFLTPSAMRSAARAFGLRRARALRNWATSPRAVATTAYRFTRGTLAAFGLLAMYWVAQRPAAPAVPAVRLSAASVPSAATSFAFPPELPPELRDISAGNQLTPTETAVVVQAAQRFNIQLRPQGQPFVVFSDPNCPSCRDLDGKLLQVDPRFLPLIVPVAFKPGATKAVEKIYCAKDRVAAWSQAVNAKPALPESGSPAGEECAGAAEKVEAANGSFAAVRFASTPTIVSATGKVISGSPGSVAELNKWLEENGGLPPVATAAPALATKPVPGVAQTPAAKLGNRS